MTLLEALEAAEQQLSKIDDLIASRSRPAVGSPYSPEVQTWLTLGLVRHEALLRVCALQSLAADWIDTSEVDAASPAPATGGGQ